MGLKQNGKQCKCKGKRGFWGGVADSLGEAIGEFLLSGQPR